jgi:hypothetical protein
VLNSFTAILPADNPQFQLLIMLDEPKALPETHGFITSGWNAVPTGGNVIARIARFWGSNPVSTCRRPTASFLRHRRDKSVNPLVGPADIFESPPAAGLETACDLSATSLALTPTIDPRKLGGRGQGHLPSTAAR